MVVSALYAVAALLALAPIAIALARRAAATAVTYGASLIVTFLLGVLGLLSLIERASAGVTLPLGLPWLGAHFRIDALSAFFLVVVNLGGAAASLYALGYGRHEETPRRVLPFYPAYLAAMNLVVLANDAFSFLVAWEFMSLTSWALVIAHHEERENLRAGYVYLVMASFGTLALLLAFGLLAGANGNYAFDAIRASHPAAWLAALVLILALIGAGSKAGLVPLHGWLPLAHPAAPSHVSALMSGVMTKVAIYGFIRIVFDLLGAPAWWWSMLVLGVGGITAVMGVLYALMQHDLKRAARLSHGGEHRHRLYRARPRARLQGRGHGAGGGAGAHRRPVPRFQSFPVQEPAVLRRRRRAQCHRRARHGAARRADPPHAADRIRVSDRLRRDFGAAAAQRLRLRMADLPGHSAQPAPAVLGLEVPGAGGGRRCWRCRRRWPPPVSCGPSASAFSAARARPLPRRRRRPTAVRSPPCSRWRRCVSSPASCPGLFIDALAPVARRWSAPACRISRRAWLSIVPIARKPQLL